MTVEGEARVQWLNDGGQVLYFCGEVSVLPTWKITKESKAHANTKTSERWEKMAAKPAWQKRRITEEPVQLKATCRTNVTLVCRQLKLTTDKKSEFHRPKIFHICILGTSSFDMTMNWGAYSHKMTETDLIIKVWSFTVKPGCSCPCLPWVLLDC